MKLNKEEKRQLELLKTEYAKDSQLSVVMKIYDMVENKKEYKEIIKFVKNTYKTFEKNYSKGDKFYQIVEKDINEFVTLTGIICNFEPDIANSSEYRMEASISITDTSNNGITAKGSGHFGGCTIDELKEFLDILNQGLKDFTKEG